MNLRLVCETLSVNSIFYRLLALLLSTTPIFVRFTNHLGIFAACLMAGTMTFSRALFNLGVFLLVAAWLLSGPLTSARTATGKQSAVSTVAIAFFLWIGVSALYSPSSLQEAWRQVASYSDLLFIPLIMVFIRDVRSYQFFITAIAFSLGTLLATLLGYLIYSSTPHNPGIFTNHIVEGYSLGVLCLGLLFFGLEHWNQSRSIATILLCLSGVTAYTVFFLNPGRGAHLALACGLLVFIICSVPSGKRVLAISGFAVVFGLIVSQSQLLQTRFNRAIVEVQNSDTHKTTSVGLRINAWKAGAELWLQSPLIGHGSKSYELLMHQQQSERVGGCRDGHNPVCLQPHNQFVLLAVEQGAIGVALFIALLIMVAWPNFSFTHWNWPPPLSASVITCFAVHACFDSGLRMGYQSFTFVIVTTALVVHQMHSPYKTS